MKWTKAFFVPKNCLYVENYVENSKPTICIFYAISIFYVIRKQIIYPPNQHTFPLISHRNTLFPKQSTPKAFPLITHKQSPIQPLNHIPTPHNYLPRTFSSKPTENFKIASEIFR